MLNFIKEKLKSNVSIIMIGTIIAQAIPFLASPFLSRIFTPEDFGVFGVYYSIVTVISVFITGRYELAIMIPEKDANAIQLVGGSFLITTFFSVLSFVLLLFFGKYFFSSIAHTGFTNWMYFIPVSVLLIGFYQALNYWSNRKSQYKRLAISRVSRSLNTVGFSSFFAFTAVKPGGLIVGDIVGQFSATMILFYRVIKEEIDLVKQINMQSVKEQLIIYKHFPMYNVPSGLLEKLAGQAPVLLLTIFFGAMPAGFFSFSQRIISAPEAVISRAFGDVFRQQASEQYIVNGQCRELFIKTFKRLTLFSIFPFIILFAFAPQLFEFIFGSQWLVAGEYTQLLTPMFFLQFIFSPLSIMFIVAQKQRADLYIQIILLIFVALAFGLGYYFFNSTKITIALFSFVYCLKYLIEGYLSYKYSKGASY